MVDERPRSLTIRTPEGIEFSLRLAGPVSRFLAWLLDMFCMSAAASIVWQLLRMVEAVDRQIGLTLWILSGFILTTGYFIFLEWSWRGQTVGKRVLRLRVVDAQGLRLTFSQVAVRNLLRAVDGLPLFLHMAGGAACVLSRRSQRLGDIAAGTVVTRIPDIRKPNLERLPADKYNSLRAWPHLVMRLRQEVSPEEAFLALRALLRRDDLNEDARLALFRQLADHFRELVAFPQESTEGMTDERYLLNAVDIIFRTHAKEGRDCLR
ncbi:MAG: RDD family protein [Syntrophobacteraceae bacterium]|nr:RDD family protein [Desulfobacteraceae bacterium]